MKPTESTRTSSLPADPHSPGARDLQSNARDEAAEHRDHAAEQRDQAAEQRDDAAVDRHLQASMRDVAATRRDEHAQDLIARAETLEQLLGHYLDAENMAERDRRWASADRHADAADRLSAGRDRHNAAKDRRVSITAREEAALDPLTGAYNRAAGFKELGRDMDRARRAQACFTLAFLDVDGLKSINDTHGHASGDRALANVVQALRAHLRAHDVIIRFGGDEFLCGVASMDDNDLSERLGHVRQTLAEEALPVHITIGLASLGPDESIDELFGRADAAFYASRKRR